jgi:hypothetical protein
LTTVPQRRGKEFTKTLRSLTAAGFGKPRLFVDGGSEADYRDLGLEVTARNPALLTYGNWVLSLWELYQRHPFAKLYALFQDDIICVKNMRQFLEAVDYPESGYLNLYTNTQNEKNRNGGTPQSGWYRPRLRGRGALALVFNQKAVQTLLSAPHIVNRPASRNSQRPSHKFVDGAIVEAMNKAKWYEYVHAPSLVQHIGIKSSMGNGVQPLSNTFPGENFDATELIKDG